MDYISQLESMFINFWWGSSEAWENWRSAELARMAVEDAFPKFLIDWIYNLPYWAVIVCISFMVLFLVLIVYFFYHLINVVYYADRRDEYHERWKKKGKDNK